MWKSRAGCGPALALFPAITLLVAQNESECCCYGAIEQQNVWSAAVMKILILGGTVFLGRRLVDAALTRGHEVTLFNRGQHNPDLYPQVEKLRGDRDGNLSALEGRRWDAVIDPSGYAPRLVRASAELLAESVDHYSFISSLSVYRDTRSPGFDESTAIATIEDPTNEDVQQNYG